MLSDNTDTKSFLMVTVSCMLREQPTREMITATITLKSQNVSYASEVGLIATRHTNLNLIGRSQATKSTRWMPWRSMAMKDVACLR